MKLYRKWFLLFLLFLSASTGLEWKEKSAKAAITWNTSKEQKTVKGNYTYYYYLSKNGSYSWIYRVERADGKKVSALRFPEKIGNAVVVKLGKDPVKKEEYYYNIWGDDVEPFHNYVIKNTDITALEIPDTVKKITAASFSGFCGLKSVKLPASMKKIPYALFCQCGQLERVILPRNLRTIESGAFAKCKKLKRFQISSEAKRYSCKNGLLLSKDKKTFCYAPIGKKRIKIPEGVETIASDSLTDRTGSRAEKVWIPASVTSIQDYSLSGKRIKEFFISGQNGHYGIKKNCIYSKVSGRLVAVAVPENGKVELPAQVKYLTNNVSQAGRQQIKTLIISKGFRKFKKDCLLGGLHFEKENKIYFKSETPPKAKDFFSRGVVYVPRGSLAAYQKWYQDNYKNFHDHDEESVMEFKEI